MTFRAAYTRSLDRETAARVDELWVQTFRDARRWVSGHRRLAAVHEAPVALALPLSVKLAARIYGAATAGEALVRLRATQAGLLREGLLLHHQTWPGDGGLGHRLTPAAVSAVNRVLSTPEAAAAILYLLFPYDRRGAEKYWHPDELTMADLGPSARTVKIADVHLPVPAHARPALLAHLTLRHTRGATSPADAFFDAKKPRRDVRRLADRALAQTTAAADMRDDDIDIPIGHGTVWMRQRRLALRNLVGATRSVDLSTPTWT